MFLFRKRISISSFAVLLLVLEKPRVADGWIILDHRQHQQQQCPPTSFRSSGGRSLPATTSAKYTAATLFVASAAATDEPKTTLEVCVSPGCVADGAESMLLKLQALVPSCGTIAVTRGVCCSLCGNGPIARDPATGKKHRKITSNQKILGLLELDAKNLDPNQEAVLEGIDLCLRGDQDLLQRKNYKGAMQHYAKGIERGMAAAIVLSGSSSDNDNGANTKPGNDNASLQWVIKALCNEATCKLRTTDTDGAIVSAGTAYQLSQKRSSDSLEVLQEAFQAKAESRKELAALQALFALYEQQEEEEAKTKKPAARRKRPSPMEANKRRSLAFRLSRLEATIKI